MERKLSCCCMIILMVWHVGLAVDVWQASLMEELNDLYHSRIDSCSDRSYEKKASINRLRNNAHITIKLA